MAIIPGMIGSHAYDGSCAPGRTSDRYDTFSVGVFEWVYTTASRRAKRGPVKVRVKGRTSDAEAVYRRALDVVAALDAGTYTGPKLIDVSRGTR